MDQAHRKVASRESAQMFAALADAVEALL